MSSETKYPSRLIRLNVDALGTPVPHFDGQYVSAKAALDVEQELLALVEDNQYGGGPDGRCLSCGADETAGGHYLDCEIGTVLGSAIIPRPELRDYRQRIIDALVSEVLVCGEHLTGPQFTRCLAGKWPDIDLSGLSKGRAVEAIMSASAEPEEDRARTMMELLSGRVLGEVTQTPTARFACDGCEFQTDDVFALVRHRRQAHGEGLS